MSQRDCLVERLRGIVGPDAVVLEDGFAKGVAATARVPLERLHDAVAAADACGFYLEALTGLDFQDTAELVYHVNCYEPRSRIAIRVLCPLNQAVPTVCDIFPGAQWHEREVHDFFGVEFAGNADLRPLLLPEDADYHPLRKTFGKVNAYRNRDEIYG